MGPYSIFFRPDNDPGEKLAPEIVAEIAVIAPSTVTAGSITTAKLAEGAVETSKLDDLAVTNDKLADGSVDSRVLSIDAVTTTRIDDGAVTPAKVGQGVTTIVDSTDAYISVKFMRVTAAQMATINAGSPNPNIIYLVN